MCRKMRESGLTEIVPFVRISALSGQDPSFFLSAHHREWLQPNGLWITGILLQPWWAGITDDCDSLIYQSGRKYSISHLHRWVLLLVRPACFSGLLLPLCTRTSFRFQHKLHTWYTLDFPHVFPGGNKEGLNNFQKGELGQVIWEHAVNSCPRSGLSNRSIIGDTEF